MFKNEELVWPKVESIETKKILKKLVSARSRLAELKGITPIIPNETIIINTLSLQEAKDSSEIENIITTHDEMFKADLFSNYIKSPNAKEVSRYSSALILGYSLVKKDKLLTINHILEIQKTLEQHRAGFRKLPGTELKNDKTGQVIYTPPQDHKVIIELMKELEIFINDESLYEVDALIKMAVAHLQFEVIHPFYDGNGRTGRIINILFLVAKGLLNIPVLYLSRYIIKNKARYYKLLQSTRETGLWEEWILFILEGVEQTSYQTILIIKEIKKIMMDYKTKIRSNLPKIYSQDLLNNIFRHPYTKIDYLRKELGVSRLTASKYLNQLSQKGFLDKHKIGVHNYYVNPPLLELLMNVPEVETEKC